MQHDFRGRKSNPTQNVTPVVDFDLKFTYVLAGWEGSAHDALILADAIERNDGFIVPQGNSLACPLHLLWQNRPIYTRSSMAIPANTLTRAYFHLYKPGSPPSVTKDLGKSTSQPRSRD